MTDPEDRPTSAEEEERVAGLTFDEWFDEIDRIKAANPDPWYYANDLLGTPKYSNGLDIYFDRGFTPQDALDDWRTMTEEKLNSKYQPEAPRDR
jgi:hypothetical protein